MTDEEDARLNREGEESGGRLTFHNVIVAPGARLPAHHLEIADTHLVILDGKLELTVATGGNHCAV